MDVVMPQLGETVTEGTVSAWFKSVGETVTAGENLFEIETDKTAMEVQALESGTLTEIRAEVGDCLAVGAVVAVIGEASGTASQAASKNAAAPPKIEAAPALAKAVSGNGPCTGPAPRPGKGRFSQWRPPP